jgi:hypothetical protein
VDVRHLAPGPLRLSAATPEIMHPSVGSPA